MMADRTRKNPPNVPGKFYVDCNCLDHDACLGVAPNNFRRNDTLAVYYICKQPDTPLEEEQMRQAIEGCPMEAIGSDGDLPDAAFEDYTKPPWV